MWMRHAEALRRPEPTSDDSRWLRFEVERLSVPHHGLYEEAANRRIAAYLARSLQDLGYRVQHQGRYRNVVALPSGPGPRFLMPRDRGDFLAVVGLGAGHRLASHVRRVASGALGVPPVVSLQAPAALLKIAPDLGRSDHLPFVAVGRPALMWTDTADFRTPHYHQVTDTPATLDYSFIRAC